MTRRLGRRLDIEAMNQATNKVTLGFKCDPQVKLELALEAESKNMSLSQYIEKLITEQRDDFYSQEEVDKIANDLAEEINFYEHTKLKEALDKYYGKCFQITNEEGLLVTLKVRTLQDIFLVFIHHIQL